MNRRFWAFTLAETLIVMGIIGVVAALTVPNLNASTGEKEKVAKVQKIYRDLNDALGRATAVYGPIEEWGLKDGSNIKNCDKFLQRLTDFLKYSKYCNPAKECWRYNDECPALILPDGTAILVSRVSSIGARGEGSYPDLIDYGHIRVDIDGPTKGKNLDGHDIFDFEITDSGMMPNGSQSGNPAYKDGNDYYATAWVIQNGNMDYLKTDSSWKCPDGKTVLNWTTNTTCK